MKQIYVGLIIIAAIMAVFIYVDYRLNIQDPPVSPPVENKTYYELTTTDVLQLIDNKEIDSSQVSVFGIKLGDSSQTILKKIGAPQLIDDFGEIINWKYEDAETNKSMLILHIVNNEVKRIIIRPGMTGLIGKSQISYTLADITSTFGKPDVSRDTTFVRVYEYHDLGLEIFHERKRMVGYAFVEKGYHE